MKDSQTGSGGGGYMVDAETTDYSVAAYIYHVVAYIRWMRSLERLGHTHKHTSNYLRSKGAEDGEGLHMHTHAHIHSHNSCPVPGYVLCSP